MTAMITVPAREDLLCPLRLSCADILRHHRRDPRTEIDDRQEDYRIDAIGRGDRRHRLFTESVHELLEIDIPRGAHAGLNCRRQSVGSSALPHGFIRQIA